MCLGDRSRSWQGREGVCCSVLPCVAVRCSVISCHMIQCVLQCVAACCSVFERSFTFVAREGWSVLQCVAERCIVLLRDFMSHDPLCVAMCCSVLQRVAVCLNDRSHLWQGREGVCCCVLQCLLRDFMSHDPLCVAVCCVTICCSAFERSCTFMAREGWNVID